MVRHLIKNGRVVDPYNNLDGVFDILIEDGKVTKVAPGIIDAKATVIEAKGKIVAPGLVDMHAHLREPGREDEETIRTGTRAALAGGYTALACMPNTEPALDAVLTIQRLKEIIKKDALTDVHIIGAITKGREGKEVVDISALKREGVVAISDDGSSTEDERLFGRALREAAREGLLVVSHCEDMKISAGGVVNEGFVSTKMGLRGMNRRAEYERVERDIALAKDAKAKIHIAHISCKESVEAVRRAKKAGVSVTAEVTPHHLALTDECCVTYDTNTKMNPPLRTRQDVEALKAALRDGTIDCIATDHAPHTDSEKDVEFDFAPFGVIGLETALSIAAMELVETKILSWKELIAKMSSRPAGILGVQKSGIREDEPADMVIIDPNKEYVYTKRSVVSQSKNSPFIDWKLKGKVTHVFVSGRLAMKDEAIDELYR